MPRWGPKGRNLHREVIGRTQQPQHPAAKKQPITTMVTRQCQTAVKPRVTIAGHRTPCHRSGPYKPPPSCRYPHCRGRRPRPMLPPTLAAQQGQSLPTRVGMHHRRAAHHNAPHRGAAKAAEPARPYALQKVERSCRRRCWLGFARSHPLATTNGENGGRKTRLATLGFLPVTRERDSGEGRGGVVPDELSNYFYR
jgi:hypothetical protein